jgi:hypothetical protein
VVIFTGAQTSKGGLREQNLPLFESYFKTLPGPRVKSSILSTALGTSPIKLMSNPSYFLFCFNSGVKGKNNAYHNVDS